MEERNKAIIGSILFVLLVLTLAIGGYFYTFKNDKHKTNDELNEKTIQANKRDANKDFIYFENERKVSSKLGITYRDVVINLDNKQATAINNEIKKENEKLYKAVKKISETEIDEEQEKLYDTDDIYSATIREYQTYKNENYISLLISDSEYNCFKGIYDHTDIQGYIFDISKNERISDVDILTKYNTSLSEVKGLIEEKLEDEQTTKEDGTKNIKIDETLEDLSYGLYIDDSGKLNIKYVVKTNNINYNDNIVID